MLAASVMAEPIKSASDAEPGAPVAKDAIDPELIKLKRARPKITLVTAAGLVFLCVLFLIRLEPDRRFASSDAIPQRISVADVMGGHAPLDHYVKLENADPLYAHAIRLGNTKGSLGQRVVPVRGTGDKLWLALPGDGWVEPANATYSGRLRELPELPFASTLEAYVKAHPRPLFATASAMRAGFTTGKVQAVSGDTIALADSDKLAFDVGDPDSSTVIGTFNESYPDAHAWAVALVAAQIPADGTPDVAHDTVRFHVLAGATEVGPKLQAAKLWAARVEPVTTHYETTWGALRTAPPSGFPVNGKVVPDADVDLVGAYVVRDIPKGSLVLLAEERPGDYWHVLPITIALVAIGLVFAWALVRAVKRDLLPPKATA
jgi:hypothetical protein